MADFASIPGGSGDSLAFDQVPQGIDAFYHIDTASFVNLALRTGDSTVDATGQDDGLTLALGKGDDNATTGDGDDVVLGGAGGDMISTGSGDDIVLGGGGADVVTLGEGDDFAIGGNGADALYGQAGDDTLTGGAGNDFVAGGAGDDVMLGGAGADTLSGGAGDDLMAGGSGADTYVFNGDFGHDIIADFEPGDTLQFASNLNGSGISVPSDLVQFVSGSAGVTKIVIGNSTVTLQGVDKDDFLSHLASKVQII
jgi:Ca2+-binding RTX toxin-like protein